MRNQQIKTVFPKEGDSKLKETIKELKAEIKNLRKEIENLKKDKKNLQKTLDHDIDYIEKLTSDMSLEEVLDLNRKDYEKEQVIKRFAEKYSVTKKT